MTKVGLIQETANATESAFRAVTVGKQGAGRTAGEALDALASQLKDDETDTLIVVRSIGPDQFFTSAQRQRLEHLMQSWRSARDSGTAFPAAEQAELEALIDAEVHATAERAAAIARELGS